MFVKRRWEEGEDEEEEEEAEEEKEEEEEQEDEEEEEQLGIIRWNSQKRHTKWNRSDT